MKKTYRLDELDCANCAARMERGIQEIPGVRDASVTFMTQKLVMDMDDDKVREVEKAALRAIHKVDADVSMTAE